MGAKLGGALFEKHISGLDEDLQYFSLQISFALTIPMPFVLTIFFYLNTQDM